MKNNGVLIDQQEWTRRSHIAMQTMERVESELLGQLPLPDEMPLRLVGITKTGKPRTNDVKYNEKAEGYNATRKWNIGSHVQLKEVFSKVGVELKDTSYETLVELVGEHPLLDLLLQWKDKQKEATTFGVEWLKHVREDTGRVHPDWRQLGARSGRMSCSDPNLQQIPRGECRRGIIAKEGHLFVRADFSQIEARIVAKISNDPVMLELFQSGGDIHKYAARAVLKKKDISSNDRQIGKSLVFGLLFSMGVRSLRKYCKINYGVQMTEGEAEIFRNRFFQAFPGLAAWHRKVQCSCETQIDFRSLLGRRRVVMGSEEYGRMGIGLNHPVQGSAADLIKMSVREVWERRAEFPAGKLVMLVHDEIVCEVKESVAVEYGKWLKDIMEEVGNSFLNPVPVTADVKISRLWGE